MLKDIDSAAIVAVANITRSKAFYADTLGLDLIKGDNNVLEFRTGRTALVVYVSDFAGTNKGNAVVWGVGDELDSIVASLNSKGVTFEHYEGMDLRGDIHVAGDVRMVWFKDPDGNILHLNNM